MIFFKILAGFINVSDTHYKTFQTSYMILCVELLQTTVACNYLELGKQTSELLLYLSSVSASCSLCAFSFACLISTA